MGWPPFISIKYVHQMEVLQYMFCLLFIELKQKKPELMREAFWSLNVLSNLGYSGLLV